MPDISGVYAKFFDSLPKVEDFSEFPGGINHVFPAWDNTIYAFYNKVSEDVNDDNVIGDFYHDMCIAITKVKNRATEKEGIKLSPVTGLTI